MAIDLDTLQEKPKRREEDWNDLFEAKGQDPPPPVLIMPVSIYQLI